MLLLIYAGNLVGRFANAEIHNPIHFGGSVRFRLGRSRRRSDGVELLGLHLRLF